MEAAAAKEYSLILKGKRTKRQRQQSPIPFSISPPLVSFESPTMEEEVTNLESKEKITTFDGLGFDVQKENVVMITSSYSSASSSSNTTLKIAAAAAAPEEYDEDQDMANCLILLAQGHSLPQNQPQEVIIRYNNNNKKEDSYRFSSRKFLETCSNNGEGKSGYYVYQCKTCDRTFPSFQALGGHRASHKKPKTTSFYSNLDLKKPTYNDTVSLLTTNTTTYNKSSNRSSLMLYGKGSNKVHECGICGAEFTSGQALGGHMRRHRGAVAVAVAAVAAVPAAANTELSLSSMSFDQISSDGQDLKIPVTKRAKINTVVSLDLDLNLLPKPEDENRFNGFSFASKQKQEQEHEEIKKRREESIVLTTTPTLVDCHY